MNRVSPWLERLHDAPRDLLVGVVRAYRLLLSPWLGGQCRFYPTCSAYTIEALERHGAIEGTLLGAGRILRCHPWCAGGHDPVPPGGLFSRLIDTAPPAPSSSLQEKNTP